MDDKDIVALQNVHPAVACTLIIVVGAVVCFGLYMWIKAVFQS